MTANRFNFRFWDKKNNYMFMQSCNNQDFEHIFIEDGEAILANALKHESGYELAVAPKDRYVLMQSTGLVDKNGNEIFEGDIVKVSQFIIEDDKIRTIDFYDGQYQAMTIWGKDKKDKGRINIFSNSPYGEKWNIEVIGNIYENKELL